MDGVTGVLGTNGPGGVVRGILAVSWRSINAMSDQAITPNLQLSTTHLECYSRFKLASATICLVRCFKICSFVLFIILCLASTSFIVNPSATTLFIYLFSRKLCPWLKVSRSYYRRVLSHVPAYFHALHLDALPSCPCHHSRLPLEHTKIVSPLLID